VQQRVEDAGGSSAAHCGHADRNDRQPDETRNTGRAGWPPHRFEEAEALLRLRLGRRETARDVFRLGRAQLGRGQRAEAMTSLDRAAARWRGTEPAAPELAALVRTRDAAARSGRDEARGCRMTPTTAGWEGLPFDTRE
jgi:hypothetical protein